MFYLDDSKADEGHCNPIHYEHRIAKLKKGAFRIAYFYPAPDISTHRYRVYNMIQAIDSLSASITAASFYDFDLETHGVQFLAHCDILVICRTMYSPAAAHLIARAKARAIKVFFDIDDLIFNVNYTHTLMRTLDLELTEDNLNSWFAKTGRFSIILQLCDHVITTNDYIADKINELTGKPVSVIPNFLNREQIASSLLYYQQKIEGGFKRRDDKIHIGYFSGSASHNKDFAIISDPLRNLMLNDERINLRIGGHLKLKNQFDDLKSRIEFLPYQDYISLQKAIAETEFNLAILQDNIFTNCKSELKYFEAAIVGCVTLASNTYSFRNAIEPGVNGYLSNSLTWFDVLSDALNLSDEKYRCMAENSFNHAYAHYNYYNQGETILKILLENDYKNMSFSNKADILGSFLEIKNQCSRWDNYNERWLTLGHFEKATALYSQIKLSIEYSIILPTYNRLHCILECIDSILRQSHQQFELIIIDDGSTDDTELQVKTRYKSYIAIGKIIYIKNEQCLGASKSRNIGLQNSNKNWIAYVDSDNTIKEHFLATFTDNILHNPDHKIFYSNYVLKKSRNIGGKSFDYSALTKANYIDLGAFIHHRDCYNALGGFDENLKRLIDWDLILRYTKHNDPIYIQATLMEYDDADSPERISLKESFPLANIQIAKRHSKIPTISTIILSYNQEKFISEAIESALQQSGNFVHEIVLSDDGSSDKTHQIIQQYSRDNPHRIRDVSTTINQGISANFKRSIDSAQGEFIAILEGDDYWVDSAKLHHQSEFLMQNLDCTMVFSKIVVHDLTTDKKRFLERQTQINKQKLTGEDLLSHNSLNLIANFSSCMFRTSLLKKIPHILYQPRLSEISLSFWLENFGYIGFLNRVTNVYRQHPNGVWSGSDKKAQLISGMQTRNIVKEVARDRYKTIIEQIIQDRYVNELKKYLDN